MPGRPAEETENEDHSSVRGAKRARGEPEQDFSGEVPIRSADETMNPPELQTAPSVRLQFRFLLEPRQAVV